MKRKSFRFVVTLALHVAVLIFTGHAIATNFTSQGPGVSTDTAKLYGTHEIFLSTGDGTVENPFDTDFRVTFKPPSQNAVTVNGFYDGGNTWRARVYVTTIGDWTWSTNSDDDSGLRNESGSFTAVSSNLRGKMRKHPRNNQRWATENGQFFLTLADTPYLLFNDDEQYTEALFQDYVQQAVAKGITLMRAGYGGGYSRWSPAATACGYPRSNWIHDHDDYDKFDLNQLKKSDERLAWLLDNYPNLYIDLHILPKSDDAGERWENDLNETQRDRTLRYIVARLAAWPQILFLIERDIPHTYASWQQNLQMARAVGDYLAANDPWDTFRGCNEKSRELNQLTLPSDFDGWELYLEVQHWGYPHATAVDYYYENYPGIPVHVFHGEDKYEKPWANVPANPSYYYRRLFWSALLSGGSGTYGSKYKTLIPYDETGSTPYNPCNGADVESNQLTGLDETEHIKQFFEHYNIDLADFDPDDSLAELKDEVPPDGDAGPSRVQCAHNGIQAYICYHPNAANGEEESIDITETEETSNRPLTRYAASLNTDRIPGIVMDLLAGSGVAYEVIWFHPTTGQIYEDGTIPGGSVLTLTAPSAFHGFDAVLYLKAPSIPFITAHRGGSSGADGWGPENTMAVFRKCIANTVNIETDLNYTSDEEIILFHGGELSATTNGTGAPTSRTLSYIQGLDAATKNGWSSEYSPEPVPTFEQLLDEFKVKATPGSVIVADAHRLNTSTMNQKLLQLLDQKSMFDRVHIQVYDLQHAADLKNEATSLFGGSTMLKLAIWVSSDQTLFNLAVASGDFIEIHAGTELTTQAPGLSDRIRFIAPDQDWRDSGVDGIRTDFVDKYTSIIYNLIPEVVLVEPLDGALISGGSVHMKANYGDSDSSITQVDFYEDSNPNPLASDPSPPYSFDWTPPGYGNYTLRAKVHDSGQEKLSEPVNITFGRPSPDPKTITESFLNNGTSDRLLSDSGSSVGTRENIVISDDTGFGWGAYNAETGGTGATMLIRDDDDIRIKDNGSYNSNRPGTYVYGIFSAIGGNSPTEEIDLSRSNPTVQINISYKASAQKLQLLLRGRNGDWYLSNNAICVSTGDNAIDISGFTWRKVASTPATDMNHLDNEGEAAMSTTTDSSPDFAAVGGAGFYIQSDGDGTTTRELRVVSMAWEGYEPRENNPPVFLNDPISKPDASEGVAYSGSIDSDAHDLDGDPVTFSKISGPEWLFIASNGTLSGTPGSGDIGFNHFIVRVEDDESASDDAMLEMTVNQASAGRVVLMVVSDASAPVGGDPHLIDRLENTLGYTVVLADDDDASFDLSGVDLVLVSASVSSIKISDTFRDASIPVLSIELNIWDDMEMTSAQTSYESQTQLDIVDAGHPMAAGLDVGLVTVTGSAEIFFSGTVGPNAEVVATIADQRNQQAAIFGYNASVEMLNGFTAPARRVGFFTNTDGPSTFDSNGWALFDAAVQWAQAEVLRGGSDASAPVGGDSYIIDRLENTLGYTVVLADGDDASFERQR